eukprot:8765958-Pyramimonas_sp.AAC.1
MFAVTLGPTAADNVASRQSAAHASGVVPECEGGRHDCSPAESCGDRRSTNTTTLAAPGAPNSSSNNLTSAENNHGNNMGTISISAGHGKAASSSSSGAVASGGGGPSTTSVLGASSLLRAGDPRSTGVPRALEWAAPSLVMHTLQRGKEATCGMPLVVTSAEAAVARAIELPSDLLIALRAALAPMGYQVRRLVYTRIS